MTDSVELSTSGTATFTFAKQLRYKCCSIGLVLSCGSNALPTKKSLPVSVFFLSMARCFLTNSA